MFESVYFQKAAKQLSSSISDNKLSGTLLFCGEQYSGKFSAAIECARCLSCVSKESVGKAECSCSSCRLYASLSSPDFLLLGHRECFLEIKALSDSFFSLKDEALFEKVRAALIFSVKKQLLRFNPIFFEGDSSVSLLAGGIEKIQDAIDEIEEMESNADEKKKERVKRRLLEGCEKLESDFLYGTLPISHARAMIEWARLKSEGRAKVVVIENVHLVAEAALSTLLKILEEPPEDCHFILTTQSKNALLPTIYSRAKVYHFSHRSPSESQEIIRRTFFTEHSGVESIREFLYASLSPSIHEINESTRDFWREIHGNLEKAEQILKKIATLKDKTVFSLFLMSLLENCVLSSLSEEESFKAVKIKNTINDAYISSAVYNLSQVAVSEFFLIKIQEILGGEA